MDMYTFSQECKLVLLSKPCISSNSKLKKQTNNQINPSDALLHLTLAIACNFALNEDKNQP